MIAPGPPGGGLCPWSSRRRPLATLTLGLTRDPLIPLGAGNGLAIGWDGRTLELEAADRAGLLDELARWLRRA